MRPAHCQLDSRGEVSRPLLQLLELSRNAMASREVSHHPGVELLLLSTVDAHSVLEILLAPPSELHDDRVLWRRHGESESTPGDVPPGPEGLPMCRRGGRDEVDPIGRSLVLDRHMSAFSERVVEVLGGDEEPRLLETCDDLWDLPGLDRRDDVDIRRRPRDAERQHGDTSDENMFHAARAQDALCGPKDVEASPFRRQRSGSSRIR